MAHSPTEIKGALLNEMLRIVEREKGAAGYATLLDTLPADLRQAIAHRTVLDGTWYRVAWGNAVTLAACANTSDMQASCRMFGRACIEHLLGGVHRFLIKSASPLLIVKHAGRFFSNYYRGGIVTSEVTSPHGAMFYAQHFEGICPELWHTIFGGMEVVFQYAGGKDVEVLRIDDADKSVVKTRLSWK